MNNELFNMDFSSALVSGYVTFNSDASKDSASASGVATGFQVLSTAFQKNPSSSLKPMRQIHPQASHLLIAQTKMISEIPIYLLFPDVVANIRARFQCCASEGGLLCTGNGKSAQQKKMKIDSVSEFGSDSDSKIKSADVTVACPGQETCTFPKSQEAECQLHGLMYLSINSEHFLEDDIFLFEFNSMDCYKQLYLDVSLLRALFGDLRGLPLSLKLKTLPNPTGEASIGHCPTLGLSLGFDFEEAKAVQIEALGLKGVHCPKALNWDAWQKMRCSMLHFPGPQTGASKFLQPISASECSSHLL